jgi:hypothetical protein
MTFHFEGLSFKLQVEICPAHEYYSYRAMAKSYFGQWALGRHSDKVYYQIGK